MSGRKRKASSQSSSVLEILAKKPKQAAPASGNVAAQLGAAQPDLKALGFELELPVLKVDGKDAAVSSEIKSLYEAMTVMNKNNLALARLQLSLAKRGNTADPAAMWTRYRDRILKAARKAMGSKFQSNLDDFYKLDQTWKETIVSEICRADAKIAAEMAHCNDQTDFITLATEKTSAVLNTVKSNLRTLTANIVRVLPELRDLVRQGRVTADGEAVADDVDVEPLSDPASIAQRIAACVRGRLRDGVAELHLTDGQLEKFVDYVSAMRDQVNAGKEPKWLNDKLRELGSAKPAAAAVHDEPADDA